MPVTMSENQTCWSEVLGSGLAQGDYLLNCPVPMQPRDGEYYADNVSVGIRSGDLIIMTQSCDLENNKVILVALCPIYTLAALNSVDPKYGRADRLEEIRRGKWEALHMPASPEQPASPWEARIVDFREIYSLPIAFLGKHAVGMGKRSRLKSPYLEHFSQAFARFFMRVGLPSAIPKFK